MLEGGTKTKAGYQRADATGTGTYSHQDFTFVRKKRGKKHVDLGAEEGGELKDRKSVV